MQTVIAGGEATRTVQHVHIVLQSAHILEQIIVQELEFDDFKKEKDC